MGGVSLTVYGCLKQALQRHYPQAQHLHRGMNGAVVRTHCMTHQHSSPTALASLMIAH